MNVPKKLWRLKTSRRIHKQQDKFIDDGDKVQRALFSVAVCQHFYKCKIKKSLLLLGEWL